MATVGANLTGSIGTQKYLCKIHWRTGELVMDEPESIGGQDLGPDPYSTLLASLAGCTLSTLRMYIDRKGWDIPEIQVAISMDQEIGTELITNIQRTLAFPQPVEPEMKQRLVEIAGKCPVSKILENKIIINTQTL